MSNNKVFILLPDGIGLRNFVFSNFNNLGLEKGFEIIYWNNTPFELANLGFKQIKIKKAKSHLLTDSYKNARKYIELNLSIKKENDIVYDTYRFPFSYKTIRNIFKNTITRFLIVTHSYPKGLKRIRERIKKFERKTIYYKECLQTLKEERPSIVFCTNQRLSLAVAPLLAAKDLGIPTATFVFSWDNLPKATMVVETDYYFVWSEHMKKELQYYYPYIDESQIFVTGTPQFESHFDESKVISKQNFYQTYKLDLNKKYICYSGDDITTCPDDSQYLSDVAEAVRLLNDKGNSFGIIFRRCPVDFSNRFDKVLKDYKDVIIPIAPLWEKTGNEWDAIMATRADVDLQINTIRHTEMVINLGSSMVFDYVAHKKPCAFINYDVTNKKNKNWSVKNIYNFIHFRSMPSEKSVIWLNTPCEIAEKINKALEESNENIVSAQKWFEKINESPANLASERIWISISQIIKK
ncbi:UDP-glycosyltransferase [Flavobacterium sp. LS1R47]|uniref:UDP-glycosyltransferase n=1 Tax=Flavobacterium frigoritolerans TaxID=2987686 RepID=A0A9X3C0Q6_9FLAO|nr:UDP-glycosyltransferase [Flavobacterium frigoritolerans]MCV9931241.1 UDP-glycosyltransferase [Flavobacterium frigoritolerans]